MVSVRVHVRDSTCLKRFSRAALDPVCVGGAVIPKVSGPLSWDGEDEHF